MFAEILRKKMKMRSILLTVMLGFTLVTQAQDDLSLLLINQPITACGHTSSETVSISLFNPSSGTVKPPYNIVYVNHNTGDTVVQAAAAGDSVQASSFFGKNFVTTVNMAVSGVYNFSAWVELPGDVNMNNDTAIKKVSSDANTIPGTVTSSDSVCAGSNGGTLTLSGNLGTVTNWVQTTAGGSILLGISDSTLNYTNLTETTSFAAIVRNGTCPFDTATSAVITVDSASLAGTITGGGAICKGASGTFTLTGSRGDVVDWESTLNPSGTWTSLSNTTLTQNYTNVTTGDDTLYRVRVKLGVCPEDTSLPAELNIDSNSIGGTVAITAGNDTVCSGANSGTLTLSNSRGAVLRWEESILGGAFASIGQAGNFSINFSNITASRAYRAIVQNGACTPIPSASFSIHVDSITVGGTINNNATVCTGTNGGTLNLSGHRGTILTWQQSTNGGGTWDTILPVNTTTSQTYSNITQTTMYRVQVKNGACAQIPSATATITVSSGTIGGTITTSDPTTICAPTNSGTLTYSGGNGAIQDWESSTDGTNFTSLSNLATTFNYSNLTVTTHFRVKVQNSPCTADYSDTLLITVLPASVAGTISGTNPVCIGDSSTMTLAGEAGSVSKWQVSINAGGSYTDIGSSAGLTSITVAVSTNSLFRVIVQNGTCDADTSNDFAVNVDAPTVGGTISSSATMCGGNNTDTLTLSGETGNIIDWILSTNGGSSWSAVPGSPITASTFIYNNLSQTTVYRVRVKSGVCPEDSSSNATITIIAAATGGTASMVSTDTICQQNGANVTVSTNSTQFGTVIGWQSSLDGGTNWSIISGATGSPAAFTFNFTVNTLFRAMVQNGAACDTVFSTAALVVVSPPTDAGTTSGNDTVCGRHQ